MSASATQGGNWSRRREGAAASHIRPSLKARGSMLK